MYCYKLILSYEGTAYSGWQIQPNAISIQQKLQEALTILTGDAKVIVIGSGRTDAGVHALAQVAHFKTTKQFDCERLLFSLNGMIPRDIRVYSVEVTDSHFHAQHSAIGKEYHYHVHTKRVMSPFKRLYAWHLLRTLDLSLLKKASQLFVGTHDFTSFTNERHAGSVAKNPVRTIYQLNVVEEEGGFRLEFYGNGFLYKMVRNIVGTLIDVASSRLSIDDIEAIFAAKDRQRASLAAPALGLFLVRVDYPTL